MVDKLFGSKVGKLETESDLLKKLIEEEKDSHPKKKLKFISLVVLVYMVLCLLKGGSSMNSLIGIEACSAGYQFFTFLILILSVFIVYKYSLGIKATEELKV